LSEAAFAGAVLAGGHGRRLGVDKAFIRIDGRPLVGRVAEALAAAGAVEIVVVGGERAALVDLGLDHMPDRWPGAGPLGGLVTALDRFESRWDAVVVLACDLIAPDAHAVRRLVDALLTDPEADAVVPLVDDRAQWLHAVWHRRCRAALEAALKSGERAIHRAVDAAGLEVVSVASISAAAVADVDTPDDLPPGAEIGP
jgi:molybdopterin-guanine dinucleotide biosynthesis protein A